MSITLTSTPLAGGDPNEFQAGRSQSGFREDDFEAFLFTPAEVQLPVSWAAIASDQEISKKSSLSVSMVPLATTVAFHQETFVQPDSLVTGEQQNFPTPLKGGFMKDADLPIGPEAKMDPSGTGASIETKGVVCVMPEKPIRPLASALQSSFDLVAPEPVETSEPSGALPDFPKSDDGILAEGLSFKSSVAGPDSISNPSSPLQDIRNASQLKSLFLAVDAQPLRPIEIELKGGDNQHVGSAEPSPGLYPAGGFELTPPRIRVSFAEIADVLRSVNDRSETAPSTVVSETPGAEAPNPDAGNGSTAFSDSGGALLQASGTSKIENADAVGIARSVHQIETEILQMASAADLRNENRSLRISLDSAELGSIEITLIRHEGGSMSAHLVTESEGSRQALNENLVQLRGSLENAGLQLQELEISCRSFSTGTQQGDRQDREGDQAAATRFHSAVTQESSGISEVNGEGHIRLLNLRA